MKKEKDRDFTVILIFVLIVCSYFALRSYVFWAAGVQ